MGCIEAWLPCGPGDVEDKYVAELRALWEILLPFTSYSLLQSCGGEIAGVSTR